MPMQTGQSMLMGLGSRAEQFLDKRKAAEPELPGGGDLPPGIENGVAQVVLCGFGKVQAGKKNAGALFFQAQAVVKTPRTFDLPKGQGTVPVAGRRTRIMKTLASSAQLAKGEFDEKAMAWAQDQLKMLAGKDADPTLFTLQRLESTAVLIQKAKPHTLFRTWKGSRSDVRQVDGKWWLCNLNDDGSVKAAVPGKGPYSSQEAAKNANQFAGTEPMTQHVWGGLVPWVEPSPNGQAAAHTQDETPQVPVEQETEASPESFDEFAGQEGEEQEEEASHSASEDLDELVAAAPDSRSARARLQELALQAGVAPAAVKNAVEWADVKELIEAAAAGEGEETTEDEETAEEKEPQKQGPEVGEVYGYKPLVISKDGKKVRGKKIVDCEVKEVNAEKETVVLKNTVDKKTIYKNVRWADLIVLGT